MAASKGVDVAEVIALYEAGRSLNQIAEKFGVRHTTVYYYHLRRAGVTLRPTGVKDLRRMPTTQRIEQLRAEGLTSAQVAEHLRMSTDGVKRRIYRARAGWSRRASSAYEPPP